MDYIQYMQKPAQQVLKLDDAANTAAYNEALQYFESLGFSGKTASDLAIEKVHSNMLFDAGTLPEINVTAKAWGNGDDASRRENYQKAQKTKREEKTKKQQSEFNQNIRNITDKWGNGIGTGVEMISGFTPLWWAAPAVRTGLDLSKGNYKEAALNAGLAFAAPYAVSKGIQYISPYAKSAILAGKLNRQIKNTKLPQSYLNVPELYPHSRVKVGDVEINDPNYGYRIINTQKPKTSLAFFESQPSKISEAERLGVPKGDRNQKIKPHDYFYSLGKYVNPKAYQKHMLELFNSPEYKQRLLDRGFSEVGAQAVIDNNIKAINQAKIRIQPSTSPGFPSGASGYANGHEVSLAEPLFGGDFTKGNNYDNVLHELGHVSDNTRFNDLFWKLQPKVEIKLSTTADKNYLLQPTEVRTRALGVIDWMRKNNKSIDDFYNMGKSYNPLFNEGVDPLFNKRAFEFFHNYTEDSGRKYLQTFYKKGGKLNYLNYIK